MNKFIIKTENFVARVISRKALKACKNMNETAHALYCKACMNGNKIVISNNEELEIWHKALRNYVPINPTEGKVYKVLAANAFRALEKRNLSI